MCGIFGFLGLDLDRDAARKRLETMAARLAHRGPDATTLRVEDGWGLGVNRLAITDPAGGGQPFATPDGGLLCIFNGEIYNHHALRQELIAEGVVFRSRCDGEILPHLYARHGLAAFARLDGMFAVALWDRRQQSLLLAVDPQGEKPLYLRPAGSGWLFASELKALRQAGDALDWPALGQYLLFKALPHPASGLAGIEKLAPGERRCLSLASGERRLERPPARVAPSSALGEVLQRAVRTCLPEDQAWGVLLSGGLDSSLVLALAAHHAGQGVPCFSVGYRGLPAPADERAEARLAAAHVRARHHEVEIGPEEVPELLRQTVWHLDEPLQDPVTVPTYALCRLARQHVRVVLSGDGADELFCGYARLRAIAGGNVESYLDGLLLARPAALAARLRPEVVAALALPNDAELRAYLLPPETPPLAAALTHERQRRMPAYHLTRVDRLAMAHGLEPRLPFLRDEVFALALGLSADELLDASGEKIALRRTAQGWLDPRTLARPKQPFTFPVLRWLAGPLREWSRQCLDAPTSWVRELLRPGALAADFAAVERGDAWAAGWIWGLLVLETWAELYLEPAPAALGLSGASQ